MNPDLRYLKKLEDIDFQPVFIMGLHRSGTSVLYKMLTSSGCFNPVTVYHLVKYDQLLDDYENKTQEIVKKKLTNSFREHGLDDRGIDKLKVSADFAEEFGFFLDNKSTQTMITKRNVSKFNEMCKKITYISDRKKLILLKNPYDFSNFIYIKNAFPNAKFVFIHRHPFKVLSSLINAVRVLFENYNYYASQISRIYNRLYENPLSRYSLKYLTSKLSFFGLMLLCYNSSKSTKYYLKNLKNLPNDCYISITYEELCNTPQQTMENIFSKLNIKPKKTIDYNSFIKPRKTTLDPSVVFLKKYIHSSMRVYCKKFGYNLD
jgi:hypothetical protein